jgi:hypothetical protein
MHSFHQFLHHHNHLGLAQQAMVAAVPSGPDWTPPPTIPIKKNGCIHTTLHCERTKIFDVVDMQSFLNSRDFPLFSCLLVVQTGSGAHPASYPMTTDGSLPWGKVVGAVGIKKM